MSKLLLLSVLITSTLLSTEKTIIEDCDKHLKDGDAYFKEAENVSNYQGTAYSLHKSRGIIYSNLSVSSYLKYQICIERQKNKYK